MDSIISKKEKKYNSFNETYKWCSFALALGLIYPNRRNTKMRIILFAGVLLFNTGTLFWFIWYLVKCMLELDVYNTTRTITVGVIILLFVFKSIYVNCKSEIFESLLKQISQDLIKANELEDEYLEIYDRYIKIAKFGELLYVVVPILMGSEYPLYAGAAMFYESLKSDTSSKHMVHEMDLKYIEHKQYEFPYFELCFAYYTLGCLVLIPNFIGFDGSFSIATSHLCMKLKLLSHDVQKAFDDSKNIFELKVRLKNCVKDHQAALRFHTLIQNVYEGWLLAVFTLTSILISCNLHQIHMSGIDPKYTMFAITGVFHMYMPCYFASCLIEVGEEISSDFYCAKWESWADPSTTRMLTFMIARSQKKLILTALGIVAFNMKTFVSLMQTSYSVFTLITSQK